MDSAPWLRGQHAIPLTVEEFPQAQRHFPIIFSSGENPVPLALMGLNEGVNIFVDDEGKLRGPSYVPAYVRRYPFVFANDEVQKRLILCIDRDASFVKEGGANPLFVDGQPSPYVQQAMEFCNNFEQERLRTEAFVKLLTELDLLETRESVFTPRNPDGSAAAPQKIAEYFAVSEEKLKALPAEKLAELRDNGALGQIYAHLVSLLGWDRLIAVAFQKAAEVEAAAGNA
jgi:hypothetical protein